MKTTRFLFFCFLLAAFASCHNNATKTSENTSDNGETVKIGVLHSLSGTMAISEVSLRDAVQMA
ncbi:MAG: livG, partial [Bacteroidetes bacterium]|nr:livG [Bacteroidota bacterium]